MKIGDRVKVVGPSISGQTGDIGHEFTICQENKGVFYTNGQEYNYPESSLQLVDEELKIGDWVEIIGQPARVCGTYPIGKIAQIEKCHKGEYEVNGWLYAPKDLRKLTPEEVQQHLAPNDIAEYRRALTKACIELNLPYDRPPMETIQEMLSIIATDREDSKYGEVLEQLSTIKNQLKYYKNRSDTQAYRISRLEKHQRTE
jgi:hypothetical protein